MRDMQRKQGRKLIISRKERRAFRRLLKKEDMGIEGK